MTPAPDTTTDATDGVNCPFHSRVKIEIGLDSNFAFSECTMYIMFTDTCAKRWTETIDIFYGKTILCFQSMGSNSTAPTAWVLVAISDANCSSESQNPVTSHQDT